MIAKRIAMTDMPQLVAAFHSLVGLAAVLVAAGALYAPEAFGIGSVGEIHGSSLVEMSLGVAIGAMTFTGSIIAFLKLAAMHVEVINEALRGIPSDRVRVHVCWGNYEGPHHHDVPMKQLLPVVLKLKADALLFEAANPRHAHEWSAFAERRIPDDKVLVPGVLSSTTNYIEHPELVAERIERFAAIVGRERVIAGTDCGFGTFAKLPPVYPSIAWEKLKSLVDGARIASERLWRC